MELNKNYRQLICNQAFSYVVLRWIALLIVIKSLDEVKCTNFNVAENSSNKDNTTVAGHNDKVRIGESEVDIDYINQANQSSFSDPILLERQIHFNDDGFGKGWNGWSSNGRGSRGKGWTNNKNNKGGGPKNPHHGRPVAGGGGGKKNGHRPVYIFESGTDIAPGGGREVICNIGDKCHRFVHCGSYPYEYFISKDRCCYLGKQAKGMCCSGTYPSELGAESIGNHFRPYSRGRLKIPDISKTSLENAAKIGYEYTATYRDIETTPDVIQLAQENYLVIRATTYIQETYFLTRDEAGIGLQEYSFLSTVLAKTCPANPSCSFTSRYRTADGSCNNLAIPKLGQSKTPLLRLLPPDYADGVWAPRVRKDGGPLPSARFITRSLVPDVNQPDPRYSHLVMQFGQFIDHDLSHVPIFRFGDMSGIDCCKGSRQAEEEQHPACFPISIPPNDPYLSGECMNFVRSMVAPRLRCDFGHADQLNQLTHWLDASQIYGNTAKQAESLREFSGGLLRVTRDPQGRHLLPLDLLDQDDCVNPGGENSGLHCFVAGDKRVNEQIGLTSMHTIWLREHNRVATDLAIINQDWDDELLYQEARRIVVAEYQHIIYNEWLPIIIGRNYMEVFGILPLYKGYSQGYSPSVDPTVSNAFTTAAFRMGHTLVQGMFKYGLCLRRKAYLQNSGGGIVGRLTLRDFFNNPHLLREPGVIDLLNKGFVTQPIQMFDNFVTTELRDHLFETATAGGMDLIALNIQRGRDHGLPSYNQYRDLCRLGKARDLSPIISPRKIRLLEQIYQDVDDIDLFIGGIFENPLPGALVGPTFVCIIGDQFARAQKADRFFYSNGDHPHSFSEGIAYWKLYKNKYIDKRTAMSQLHDIRSVSMARILCDNSDEIRSLQPLAFHLPNDGFNPVLPCGSPAIPQLDLALWKEL